jgi:hypothetical protein
MELILGLPAPDEPGYLRRQIAKAEFFASIASGETSYGQLVEFVLTFVREPEDPEAARDALLDLSRDEWGQVLAAIRTENIEVLPNESETSENS